MSDPKEHQQYHPSEKAGFVSLKLRTDSGLESDGVFRISAIQWGDILAICADKDSKYSNSGEPS